MDEFEENQVAVSLGEQLRRYREQAGMSVEQAARESKIALRYVRALEEGDWHAFSAKVYAQGAMRRVAHVLKDVDADALVAACGREWDIACGGNGKGGNPAPRAVAESRRFLVTPRRLGAAAAIGMAVLLVAFLAVRLIAFIAAPGLAIKSPADENGFPTSIVEVSGKTEKESSLTVNGRELTLDEWGNFNEKIELPPGAVSLHFISRNRFGKTQTAVRNILVE